MSIADKLNKIHNVKEEIKNALIYKGLTVTDQFDTYPEHIRNLTVDGILKEYPFLKIGYQNQEEAYWINKQINESLEVINKWDKEATAFKGQNIWFFPVVDTSKATTAYEAFENMSNLKSIGLIDTSNITDMGYMFYNCYDLVTIPKFNTSKVTTMSHMFSGCRALEYIPQLDVSSLIFASNMFERSGIKEFPLLLNTSNITDMNQMFYDCDKLESAYVSAWDTSSVTDMGYMFRGCDYLKEIDFTGCDLSKIQNLENIVSTSSDQSVEKVDFTNAKINNKFRFSYFRQVPNIIFNNLDATKVTDISYWFSECSKITEIDMSQINFGDQITDMYKIFYNCSKLQNINFGSLNTEFVTDLGYAFYNCDSLETLDLSSFNTKSLKNIDYLFNNSSINTLILDGWDFSSVISNSSWVYGLTAKNVSLKNVKAKGDFQCPHAHESIDLTGIDTTACTSFKLSGCNVPTIDLSSLDTSNFTSMSNMFEGCASLVQLDLSNFDYTNVTSMSYMFYNCSNLESITLNGNNQSKSLYRLFSNCISLKSVDLTHFPLDTVTDMSYMFDGCTGLKEIKMGGNPPVNVNISNIFNNMYNTTGTFYYNNDYDYTDIIDRLPSSWKVQPLIENGECISLTIEANNVSWSSTSTTIKYRALVNGINPVSGNHMLTIELTGEAQSEQFEQNTTEEDLERTINFNFMGATASTTIVQTHYTPYYIELNDQWRLSTDVPNPDDTLYDGVYESFSNYNIHSKNASCTIVLPSRGGYSEFSLYVRSNGESSYDYVKVFDLNSTSSVKYSTSGIPKSGTTIDDYTLVKFTDINTDRDNTIQITYVKDSSHNNGTDKGYLLIPKNQ